MSKYSCKYTVHDKNGAFVVDRVLYCDEPTVTFCPVVQKYLKDGGVAKVMFRKAEHLHWRSAGEITGDTIQVSLSKDRFK